VLLSREINRTDVTFWGELMDARLAGRSDPGRAAEMLGALLKRYGQDPEQARLHYEIFCLTGGVRHRAAALETYEKLYGKTPKADYRDKMAILKQNN